MASFKYPKTNKNSLRALAYAIRNELSGGISTDDSNISIRQIEYDIKMISASIQKEQDDANELLGLAPSSSRIQTFCLPLVDSTDLKCKCTKDGARFKKAVIPTMYNWKSKPFISFIGNTEMDFAFVPVADIHAMNAFRDEITRPTYFNMGANLYVNLPKKYALMCNVMVSGIPEDSTSTSGSCFDAWSKDWVMPSDIKALTKQRIMETSGRNLLATLQGRDIRNNANQGNQFTTSQTP